jgi:hypothetical protein
MVKVKTSIRPRSFGKMLEQPGPVDPARFGDSIAFKTNWEPLNTIGDSYRSYKLVRVGPDRMEFRRVMSAVAMFAVFPLAGILILFYTFSGHFSTFTLLLGLGFTLLGAFLVYSQLAPIVFDKSSGMFSKGRGKPGKEPDIENPKKAADLDSIHALQLLWKPVYGGKKQYYGYDLNLVLKNGKRIFILSHADKNAMKEDARTLSEFLGKPLWDVTE